MNISFRTMTQGDADAVAKVEEACFPVPWSRKSFWEAAANSAAFFLLCLDGNKIIGYVGTFIVLDEAQITNVAIAPLYRGKSLGRKLMEELFVHLNKRGVTATTLEVRPSNKIARNLYISLGFREAGIRKGYYENNGEDAIIMWKTENKEQGNEGDINFRD